MKRTSRKAPEKRKNVDSHRASDLLIKRAYASLKAAGVSVGKSTSPLEIVLDTAILTAARDRTGIVDNSALINAALTVLAAGDDFGLYLIAQAGRLSADFELAV